VLEAGFERREMYLFQKALVEMDWITIPSPIAHVCHEMFGCRDNPHLFERTHKGDSHCCCEERVLAVRFLHPATANVTGYVDHGRQILTYTPRSCFRSYRCCHFPHQRCIECCS